MKCQYCSCIESKVVDSRPADDNRTIRRRRVCLNCGRDAEGDDCPVCGWLSLQKFETNCPVCDSDKERSIKLQGGEIPPRVQESFIMDE